MPQPLSDCGWAQAACCPRPPSGGSQSWSASGGAADAQGADLSGAQIAALKREMAGLLRPGESVGRAMKRLRPAKPQKGAHHAPGA